MQNIFEAATRKKLRFPTTRGAVSIEDLWDLSLEELNGVAKKLNKELKDSAEESFIGKKTNANVQLQLHFDVTLSIINTRLAEEEKKKNAIERKIKRDKILSLIADKQDSALARKSIASLETELDKLEEEDVELN